MTTGTHTTPVQRFIDDMTFTFTQEVDYCTIDVRLKKHLFLYCCCELNWLEFNSNRGTAGPVPRLWGILAPTTATSLTSWMVQDWHRYPVFVNLWDSCFTWFHVSTGPWIHRGYEWWYLPWVVDLRLWNILAKEVKFFPHLVTHSAIAVHRYF